MRAYTASLPILAAAILFTITTALDSEPPQRHYYATLEGRTLTMHDSIAALESRIPAAAIPEVHTYTIPRFTADLEGDLSPVGDGSTNRLHDFPAWAPRPTPTPTPVAVVATARPLPAISSTPLYALSEAEMRDVLTEAGWPVELHDAALRVAWCESNYRPGVVGDHGLALGLFQIHIRSSWQGWWEAFGFDQTRYADPVYNAQLAWRIYQYEQERGYPPFANWSCRP